jgi:hypothetical protein
LANSLKLVHPTYLPMDDACGFVTSILSKGQARKARLLFNNHDTDVGPEVGHIPGILNYLADALSRGDLAVTIPEKMGDLTIAGCRAGLQVQAASTSVLLRRFQPAPELLSALESAILQKSSPWLLPPNASSWGQMLPDYSITLNLHEDSWSCQTRSSKTWGPRYRPVSC